MRELKPYITGERTVATKAHGNPEGKGLSGFLLDWYRTEPRGVVVKSQRQVLAEFFTSLLVLSAKFKYRPAVNVPNYLYWVDDEWSLSLISPEEWSEERRAGFACKCLLQPDMTWTIEPSAQLSQKSKISTAVGRFYDAFVDTLNSEVTLEEILPFYVESMPYYQRLHANALSRSIRGAMAIGGHTNIQCRDWQQEIPQLDLKTMSQLS